MSNSSSLIISLLNNGDAILDTTCKLVTTVLLCVAAIIGGYEYLVLKSYTLPNIFKRADSMADSYMRPKNQAVMDAAVAIDEEPVDITPAIGKLIEMLSTLKSLKA